MIKRKDGAASPERGRPREVSTVKFVDCPYCNRKRQSYLLRQPSSCVECQLRWEEFIRNQDNTSAAAALQQITHGSRRIKLDLFMSTGDKYNRDVFGRLAVCHHCLRKGRPYYGNSRSTCVDCALLMRRYNSTPTIDNAFAVIRHMRGGVVYDKAMQAMRERIESGELSEEQVKEYREISNKDWLLDYLQGM